MLAPATRPRRFQPLIGVAAAAFGLLLILALLEGPEGRLACDGKLSPDDAGARGSGGLAGTDTESPDEPSHEAAPGPSTPELASVVSAAPEPRRGNVDGRVVDEHTSEPVPELTLTLRCGELSETLVTDANGTFASGVLFPTGRLGVSIEDDGQPVGSAHVDHDGRAGTHQWRIEAPVGPTYPIVTVNGLVPDPIKWRARLVEGTLPPGSDGEIDVAPGELSVAAPRAGVERRVWTWARLRAGAIPWVRFPRLAFAPSGDYFPRLDLRSDSGFEAGSVHVKGTVGLQHGIRLRARPFGTLSGSVVVADAVPIEGLRALLVDLKACGPDREYYYAQPDWHVHSGSKSFAFDDVEPGEKLIFVLANQRRVVQKRVRVAQGAESLLPIELAPPLEEPVRFDIAGSTRPRWRDGRQVLRIRYEEFGRFVPAVVIDSRTWLPSRLEAPPMPVADTLVELCGVHQPAIATDWQVRAREGERQVRLKVARAEAASFTFAPDPASGTAAFALSFGPSGSMIGQAQDPRAFELPESDENPMAAIAWAAGCLPQPLRREALRLEGSPRTAIVRMQPGWGAQLVFRDRESAPAVAKRGGGSSTVPDAITAALACVPVPNVRVEMNGVSLGASDANGEVLVTLSSMPVRLTLQGGAFELAELQTLGDVGVRYIAWMRRKAVTAPPP